MVWSLRQTRMTLPAWGAMICASAPTRVGGVSMMMTLTSCLNLSNSSDRLGALRISLGLGGLGPDGITCRKLVMACDMSNVGRVLPANMVDSPVLLETSNNWCSEGFRRLASSSNVFRFNCANAMARLALRWLLPSFALGLVSAITRQGCSPARSMISERNRRMASACAL